jgi:CRISPR-associated protein Cas2
MSNFMRIMVFFDLPVTKKEDRKIASKFRKDLVNEGYYMLQFSVYGRLCQNVENALMHIERLKNFIPNIGSVRCMLVTEKQYNSMIIMVGTKK